MATEQAVRSARLSPASAINVAGLLAFAATIVVQIAGGVDTYPTIPPGLVISLVVAALVIFGVRWRWTPLVAWGWPIMLTVGAFLAEEFLEALAGDRGAFVQMTGIAQGAALAVAVGAGAVAVVQRYRPALDHRPARRTPRPVRSRTTQER